LNILNNTYRTLRSGENNMAKKAKEPLDLNKLRQDIVFKDTLMGHELTFHTTWGLFSPRAIDEGTQLLLKHMDVKPDDTAIDLGCGYGPIGMSIAKSAPQGSVLMVDKDFVAIEYANANCKRNNISNANAMLSDGLKHIPKQNYLFFYDIKERLEPGGRFYVVVISGLRRFIERAFEEVFGNHCKVKQGQTYTVAMATKES
jgi:16S rRNA (guanine1207-N2)-methyltransferase